MWDASVSYDCVCIAGLGKSSQGISTALSVEKTSKRGGKIVSVAAERGQYNGYTYVFCMYVCTCVST